MKIRIGIDVGGTHTKAVAIDSETLQMVGEPAVVMTTHSDELGVSRGVVESFNLCLKQNNINPEDVIFVAHSTTQATNALLEGDVQKVGILTTAKKGIIEGILAQKQGAIQNITLNEEGKQIQTYNAFEYKKNINEETVDKIIKDFIDNGVKVVVANGAYSVDNAKEERIIKKVAIDNGLLATMASDITKLYGLQRRATTAVINASILPKMLDTANSTNKAVHDVGIKAPLMIMRGDGGVMDISEMKERPILTMLSGPAASIIGSLTSTETKTGIYFEVGGTSTNIGIIRDGRPGIDYISIGGYPTYVDSLDVWVLGVAGGSMIRASNVAVIDVGPRSAHIGGLEYAVYNDVTEADEPKVEFFSPLPGDPEDYVRIRLKNGKAVAITTSCAANALGLVKPEHFSYGNAKSARICMKPLADMLNISVDELADIILLKAFMKIKPVIEFFEEKYKLDMTQIPLIGVGGGASALIIYAANKLGLNYFIPEKAEVISSIGAATSMMREVVERQVYRPEKEDEDRICEEARQKLIAQGAKPESIEVKIEFNKVGSILKAVAIGSSYHEHREIAQNNPNKNIAFMNAQPFTKNSPFASQKNKEGK